MPCITLSRLIVCALALFLHQPATAPSDEEEDEQLRREREELRWKMPQRVEGAVTDAETNQPIARFTLIPGLLFKRKHGEFRRFDYESAQEFEDGRYEWANEGRQPDVIVRIEADGYEPVVSHGLSDHIVATFDAKLKRATGLSGSVVTPGGEPAGDAQVIFSTRDAPVTLNNEEFVQRAGGARVVTAAADGRFETSPLNGDWRLVVLHETGTAELSRDEFPKDGVIQLRPWARIEGTLRVGAAAAAADETVQHYPVPPPPPDVLYVWHLSSAKVGEGGAFVFDRVTPGVGRISRQIVKQGPGDVRLYAGTGGKIIDAKPGETLRVELGGVGRPVIGTIVRAGGFPENWFAFLADASEMSPPRDGAAAVAQKERRHYSFNVEPDGRFRIDDVEPGSYQLTVQFGEVPGKDSHIGGTVARVQLEFTVPAIPGGQTDEALDLGAIELE